MNNSLTDTVGGTWPAVWSVAGRAVRLAESAGRITGKAILRQRPKLAIDRRDPLDSLRWISRERSVGLWHATGEPRRRIPWRADRPDRCSVPARIRRYARVPPLYGEGVVEGRIRGFLPASARARHHPGGSRTVRSPRPDRFGPYGTDRIASPLLQRPLHRHRPGRRPQVRRHRLPQRPRASRSTTTATTCTDRHRFHPRRQPAGTL